MTYEKTFAKPIRIGARGSSLSRIQTQHVAQMLQKAWPSQQIEIVIIRTRGDEILEEPLPEIGGKGLFTAEIEAALQSGHIDLAVHSQKDLPVEDSASLACITTTRENPQDALVSRRGYSLSTLPLGASVGTSSTRRAAQLLNLRPDLKLLNIRGNVDTRVSKALDESGPYDAIVLAFAGLARLKRLDVVSEALSPDVMLPAPAQGALAVQYKIASSMAGFLEPIFHMPTHIATLAERTFLQALGGGCSIPVAAYACLDGDDLLLNGSVLSPDGKKKISVNGRGLPNISGAQELGLRLAEQAIQQGAQELLGAIG